MGHVTQSKIEKTYDRYEYWLEKRTAVIKWQDRLRSIIDSTAPKIATPSFGRNFWPKASVN